MIYFIHVHWDRGQNQHNVRLSRDLGHPQNVTSYKLQVFYLSDAQNDTGSDWALKFLRQDAAQTYHNITTHNIHNITMTYTLHKYYEHNLHIINI